MKKKVLLILFISFSVNIFSQKYVDSLYNFKVDNESIIWQKVFKNKDLDKIKTRIKTQEFTNKLKEVDSSFSGRSNKYNKRVVKNSPYFATFGFDAFLKIEFKPNKYRVTISDIVFDGPVLKVFSTEQKQDYPLNLNVLRKKRIKNSKRNNNVLKKLDSILNSKFIITKTKQDDW